MSSPEGRRLLAPWSERVRFGMKKNGYHGGATLQEVVLPFGIFALPETAAQVAGWREAAEEFPRLVAMAGRDASGGRTRRCNGGCRPARAGASASYSQSG